MIPRLLASTHLPLESDFSGEDEDEEEEEGEEEGKTSSASSSEDESRGELIEPWRIVTVRNSKHYRLTKSLLTHKTKT